MIPMACPHCGRRGSVPADKLNSRLHCKKCGTVFHMDFTGHIVLGEPGRSGSKSGGTSGIFSFSGQESGNHGKVGSDTHATCTRAQPTEMPTIWESLPKSFRVGLLGGLALVLLWVLGAFRLLQPAPLPSAFEQRLTYVAEAFAYNEPSGLRRIAASGTGGDLGTWLEKLHPDAKLGARREVGYLVSHTYSVVGGGSGQEKRVMLFVTPPIPKFPDPNDKAAVAAQEQSRRLLTSSFAPGSMPDGSFAVPLVWKSEGGQWWLDGTASLQAAANPAVVAETDRASNRAS